MVYDIKILLTVFWGSLGLVLGALGGFLGALFLLLGTLGGSLNFRNFFFGLRIGLFVSLLGFFSHSLLRRTFSSYLRASGCRF